VIRWTRVITWNFTERCRWWRLPADRVQQNKTLTFAAVALPALQIL